MPSVVKLSTKASSCGRQVCVGNAHGIGMPCYYELVPYHQTQIEQFDHFTFELSIFKLKVVEIEAIGRAMTVDSDNFVLKITKFESKAPTCSIRDQMHTLASG